ncbi:MAG: phosphoribosyl-ATP diphosphatase [Rhodospirillaceae bacterium]|jgi:phosphoribosyl-ATP pyrophosphohydrolase|nr:phosphoribosyl-ATP diphosphatase [Rhodospirillaceae bacterium]MBT6285391.1 phosphoribosyl-ATP diphosphatase [Rhodospirillaceae bacterium]
MSKDLNTDAVIDRLFETVASRKGGDAAESYTAKLFARGTDKIAQKLGEEAVETVIAAVTKDRDGMIGESADLIYHLLVLWADAGIRPEDVLAELERREGTSGIAEKASRKE